MFPSSVPAGSVDRGAKESTAGSAEREAVLVGLAPNFRQLKRNAKSGKIERAYRAPQWPHSGAAAPGFWPHTRGTFRIAGGGPRRIGMITTFSLWLSDQRASWVRGLYFCTIKGKHFGMCSSSTLIECSHSLKYRVQRPLSVSNYPIEEIECHFRSLDCFIPRTRSKPAKPPYSELHFVRLKMNNSLLMLHF